MPMSASRPASRQRSSSASCSSPSFTFASWYGRSGWGFDSVIAMST
jgi:hypothetical protein